MKELALIDGDIVCYRCAASAANDPEEVALQRVDNLINRITHETNSIQYQVFLTGDNNFRYTLYPDYKAHRKDKPKPLWLNACKEHLVKHHKASISDGNEADDEIAIVHQTEGLSTLVASIDKDFLQLPGYHYNFVKEEQVFVSPLDGMRFFYKQTISGDGSDNIPGFDHKCRNKIPKFMEKLLAPIDEMTEEEEMYKYALGLYETEFGNPLGFKHIERVYHRNCNLLWLQRKENDTYLPPGQKHENTAS